jgi:uncharacterized protein
VSGLADEVPITFDIGGDRLAGIIHLPAGTPSIGVIIVVGGPQYRVGSHRQFVLLARSLASRGIAVLRFDCRGMGDSDGDFQGFEQIEPDIAAATNAMVRRVPSLGRIVLWGLCDATFGICAHARRDPRIAGVVLVNPWVRSESSYARTQLKHYYLARLAQSDFLRKVLTGQFNFRSSGRALLANIRRSLDVSPAVDSQSDRAANPLEERMAADLQGFTGGVLLILSGRDLTAKEFDDATRGADRWQRIFARPRAKRCELADADHTFSRRAWRDQVAEWTFDWLKELSL